MNQRSNTDPVAADPYRALGVDKTATAEQIRAAYRRLAKKLHPDLNPGDRKAEEEFKKVSAAYAVLGDAKTRERFDRGEIDATGAEAPQRSWYRDFADAGRGGADRYNTAHDFADFVDVDDILGEMFRRQSGARRRGAHRGNDIQADVTIGLEEAARGTTVAYTTPDGRRLDVHIPPGVADRQVLRLKGQGMPGHGGADPGDAYVEVRVQPHAMFRREGSDIHIELPVTIDEAVLGARITVPTLTGDVTMVVPPSSNAGTVLRLKGRGLPSVGTAHLGDQYVTLKLVLPDAPDEQLKEFLKNWREQHAHDPRRDLRGRHDR